MIETERAHCPICGSAVEVPVDLLAGLAAAPAAIAKAVRSAPGSGDGWSPGEIAAHLADSEVGFAWRLRQVLAQDEPELQPFDQDDWARVGRYGKRDPAQSLALFRAARLCNLTLLKGLSTAEWECYHLHEERGKETVARTVLLIAGHDINHLAQIQRIRTETLKKR